MQSAKFKTVNEYVATLPAPVKKIVKELRATIKEAAPGAEEIISYNMPAYKLNKMLVYFAAHKNHLGLYPISKTIEVFKKELAAYEGSKGTVKFPYDQPMPLKLISRIVKYRVAEDIKEAQAKKKK